MCWATNQWDSTNCWKHAHRSSCSSNSWNYWTISSTTWSKGNVGEILRRSTRKRKSTIPSVFVVYFQESDYGVENDPDSLLQAMNSKESELLYNAMKETMNSM